MACACWGILNSVWAESILSEATFVRIGARYRGFFDESSTGAVVLTVAPGASATSEPLVVEHLVLTSDDAATTLAVYDPSTTFVLAVAVADCPVGPQYLIVRLPVSHRIRWSYFVKAPATPSAPTGDISRQALRARYHRLALRKLGAFFDADTTGTWLGNDPEADYHWMREDIYYAVALLDDTSSASHRRGNEILDTLSRAQDRTTTSPTYGWFYTNAGDMRVPNNASTFFISPILAHLCLSPPPTLDPNTLTEMRTALRHVVDGVMTRFTFGPVYENFYFMGTATLAIAAGVFDEPELADLARTKMRIAFASYLPNGAHPESNSPVYIGVTAWALGLLLQDAQDTETLALARHLVQRMFLDLALYHQPSIRQQAGPFSRVYEDGLRGGAGLTAFLTALELEQEGYDSPMRLAEMFDGLHTLDINPCYWQATRPQLMDPHIVRAMREERPLPAFVRQRNYHCDTAAYLSSSFSLGTDSATTFPLLGNEGFVLQVFEPSAGGGYAVTFARAGATNDEVLGYASGTAYDMFGFQHGGRALWLVDRTFAASEPPARRAFCALVSDERFAQWGDVRVNGVAASLPLTIQPGDVVTARRRGAFLAVQFLYATPIGPRVRSGVVTRSAGHFAIVAHALDAATPQPVAGARLDAAFAVTCEETSAWNSYDEFVEDYLTRSRIEIVNATTTRSFAWDYGVSMECTFDRAARRWLRREVEGTEIGSPLLDADFAVQGETSTLALRDFAVSGAPPYMWMVYPHGTSSVLLANPTSEELALNTSWTSSPVTMPPYGFVLVTRPPAASAAQWEEY